jgi:SAM-dependent methyltransferase
MTETGGAKAPGLPRVAQPIDGLDIGRLREAIREEYATVASDPDRGFHFHTGRPLARLLGYDEGWLEGVPEESIASFAGTGNPFSLGLPKRGDRVVDVGAGAGIDSLIAGKMVGPEGRVIGIDMTPAMVAKAGSSATAMGARHVEFREGLAESLAAPDEWADLVISNGVMNLFPDKLAGLGEMARVLKPGGHLQIGDILVQKPVGDGARRNIDLWKG